MSGPKVTHVNGCKKGSSLDAASLCNRQEACPAPGAGQSSQTPGARHKHHLDLRGLGNTSKRCWGGSW